MGKIDKGKLGRLLGDGWMEALALYKAGEFRDAAVRSIELTEDFSVLTGSLGTPQPLFDVVGNKGYGAIAKRCLYASGVPAAGGHCYRSRKAPRPGTGRVRRCGVALPHVFHNIR